MARATAHPTICDVLVVGAGPAGLFAALGAASAGRRVLVVDAGADVEARRSCIASVGSGRTSGLVEGVGGAGLFSDGKLCLSLGVGGELPAGVTVRARGRLLHMVAAVLEAEDALGHEEQPDIAARDAAARRAGLDFSYYPVLHIGTDHCAEKIVRVRDRVLERGGRIMTHARLVRLERGPRGGFKAAVRTPNGDMPLSAGSVVLAMGKVGSAFENELCLGLGAVSSPLPMYIGVRLETDSADMAPLFGAVTDPKYKLYFEDGTKMKTHCAADGGEVLALCYDGLPLAGGHAFRHRSSGRSSVGILWDGVRGREDAHGYARALMQRSAGQADGLLLAQRLCDYRNRRSSARAAIERCEPSTDHWQAGDLRGLLPSEYFERFDRFVGALGELAPHIESERTVLFAPAVEWWMRRVATDGNLQTDVPGLYVAGDGAGWSQGIVHAAATGLLAAEGIVGRPLGRARLVGRRVSRPAKVA